MPACALLCPCVPLGPLACSVWPYMLARMLGVHSGILPAAGMLFRRGAGVAWGGWAAVSSFAIVVVAVVAALPTTATECLEAEGGTRSVA